MNSFILLATALTFAMLSVCEVFAGEDNNLILPGVGLMGIQLGGPLPSESIREEYLSRGIFISSSEGTIVSIVVVNQNLRTDKGIRVGDSLEKVVSEYGEGRIGKMSLKKGDKTVGDSGLTVSYDNIVFSINDNQVSAIILMVEN